MPPDLALVAIHFISDVRAFSVSVLILDWREHGVPRAALHASIPRELDGKSGALISIAEYQTLKYDIADRQSSRRPEESPMMQARAEDAVICPETIATP